MGSYGKSKFTNWFRTFATKLLPKKDYMNISPTFNAYWGDDLEDGITHCLDPNGNIVQLQVSSEYDERPEFVSGVMKMARFYGLATTHFVVFHYKGVNLFHIRVFGNNFEEIGYPLSNRPHGCIVNNNFYRTLKTKLVPYKDNMVLGDNFNFFWRDDLNGNRAKVVDPEGNFFYLKLSVDANDLAYVSGGVVQMARFYQLKSIHHCWMHYLGDHQFQMKIVGLDMMEISYPVVIELFGQESEEDSDSENGKDAEEDEDDEGEGDLTGDDSSSESEGNIKIPHVRSWTKKLSKTSAGGRKTMPIPARFVNTIILPEQTDMYIHVQGGGKYHCTVKNSCRRDKELYLAKRWYKFVKDNKLHAGDSLSFWFGNDPNVLNVKIIRKMKRSEIDSS